MSLAEDGSRKELQIIFSHVFKTDTQAIRNRIVFAGLDLKSNCLPSGEYSVLVFWYLYTQTEVLIHVGELFQTDVRTPKTHVYHSALN